MEALIKVLCGSILHNFLLKCDHRSWSTDVRSPLLATLTTDQSMSADNRCTTNFEYNFTVKRQTEKQKCIMLTCTS